MTEEIIIDCAFYKDGVCASPINKTCEYCKNIDVSKCYYKQLKRLEFELKVTKADYEASEQENKELKKQIESQKGLITVGGKQQYEMTMAYDKCKTVLEEIKTVINQPCDNCKYNKDGITCSIGDCGEGKLKIIENKINEVLQ